MEKRQSMLKNIHFMQTRNILPAILVSVFAILVFLSHSPLLESLINYLFAFKGLANLSLFISGLAFVLSMLVMCHVITFVFCIIIRKTIFKPQRQKQKYTNCHETNIIHNQNIYILEEKFLC